MKKRQNKYKTIVISIAVAALLGCLIWWFKEGGWEPKVASLTALITILTLGYDLNKGSKETPTNQVNAETITNSPISRTIGTQNNYYVTPDSEIERKDSLPNAKETKKLIKPNPKVKNEVKLEGQKEGVTANNVTANIEEKADEGTVINKASSTNQQGGITANTVNIFKEKPPTPPIELYKETLNSINQKALDTLLSNNRVCIVAQQTKMQVLMSRRNEISEFVTIQPGGNMITAVNSKFGDCLNDIDDYGIKDIYEIKLLKEFDK